MRYVRSKETLICIKESVRCRGGLTDICDQLISQRFMAVPRQTLEKDLKTEERGLSDELNGLNKKAWDFLLKPPRKAHNTFQSKYLEKQFNDAQSQLRDIVSSVIQNTTK